MAELGIEQGEKFYSRKGHKVAVIEWVNAGGGIGYRLKGTRRIYETTPERFMRLYKRPDACEVCNDEGFYYTNGHVRYGEIVHDLVNCYKCNAPSASPGQRGVSE